MVVGASGNWLGSLLPSVCGAVLVMAWANPARAQTTLRVPGLRPKYAVELEPHLVLSPFDAPDDPSGDGYGFGARASLEIAPEGFIENLNDSVGIGFGLDWVHYDCAVAGCASASRRPRAEFRCASRPARTIRATCSCRWSCNGTFGCTSTGPCSANPGSRSRTAVRAALGSRPYSPLAGAITFPIAWR